MRVKGIWLASMCLFHSLAYAADANPPVTAGQSEPVAAVQIGMATEAVLDLQRSQLSAAPMRPLQGEQASRAYQRYLDSFRQPMPATAADGVASSSGKTAASGK